MKNLLKLFFVAVTLLAFSVANAQVSDGNYVDATGEVTMHTQGKTVGLYVQPDVAYNPDYNGVDGWVLNPSALWTWTYPGGLTGSHISGADVNSNYIEFTAAAAVNNYDINVVETNSVAGCNPDAGTDHTLVILPQPTFAVNTGGLAWGHGTCGTIAGHAVTFNLTAEPLANGHIWAQWRLKEYEVTIDGATGDEIIGAQVGADAVYTWNKHLTSPQPINTFSWAMTAGAGFLADGAGAPSLATMALSMTRDYPKGGSEIAYLYRWEISLADGDGINDRISRKSDYIDGGTTVYGTDGVIEIFVVGAPTTGPIFHVPRSYGE